MADHQIHNETIKLSANYLNGVAIAMFAVGGLGPWLAILYGTTPFAVPLYLVSLICVCCSFALHFAARGFLKRLK